MVSELVLTAAAFEMLPPLLVAMEFVAALVADELVILGVLLVTSPVIVPETALVDAVPVADSPVGLT